MKWRGVIAALLGLLMMGVTAGSASALQIGSLKNNQLEAFKSSFQLHERTLNSEFLRWYYTHYGRLSKSINQKQLTKIFSEFLKEDPIALRELKEINKIQRSIIDLGLTYQSNITNEFNIQQKSYYTNGYYYCYGYCSEEKVRVTINYLKVHVVWWDITYGEVDKFNWLYTGSKAKEFYDRWSEVTKVSGYASVILSAEVGGATALGLIEIPTPVSLAIVAAFAVAGLTLTYETSEMDSYYESTNWQYIWIVLENDYYYPWVPVMSLTSHFSIYGYNAGSGKKYTFLPSVSIPAVGGYTNAVISSMLSKVAHDWIKNHGSGWVTVA